MKARRMRCALLKAYGGGKPGKLGCVLFPDRVLKGGLGTRLGGGLFLERYLET